MQWPPLRREGFRLPPALDLRDQGLRRVLLLMGPGTLGLAATQVNLFVNTLLATGQGTGAVSWLNYAFRLMYLPIGLFGVSIATAVLPAVGAARGRRRSRRPCGRRSSRGLGADAHRQRAGDGRPLGARRRPSCGCCSSADGSCRRTRSATAAALQCLRRGPRRILRRAHRVAGLLRARPKPSPGDGQRGVDCRQRSRQPGARQPDGLSRPGARHVARGARQRRRSVWLLAAPAATASTAAPGVTFAQGHGSPSAVMVAAVTGSRSMEPGAAPAGMPGSGGRGSASRSPRAS